MSQTEHPIINFVQLRGIEILGFMGPGKNLKPRPYLKKKNSSSLDHPVVCVDGIRVRLPTKYKFKRSFFGTASKTFCYIQ